VPTDPPAQARHWRTAADALSLLRSRPGLTRSELREGLGLGSGGVSDLASRMRDARLVVERPAGVRGPGRPTSTLHAHPQGPVALAVDVRHGDWRLGVCSLDGDVRMLAEGVHGADPDRSLTLLGRRVTTAARRLAGRAVALGIAVPGQVTGDRLLQASMLGWRDVDLSRVAGASGLPVHAGNDAAMAAVAEARTHPSRPAVLLHVVVEVGLGGALVVGGLPVPGARGLHGEFGHLPMGDADVDCPCGARGCWGVPFDPREVARRLGEPMPTDPRSYLEGLLQRRDAPAPVLRLREDLAHRLGRGLAGLVNAVDPDAVTLGALAGPVRDAAPDRFAAAYDAGLMSLHRDHPPLLTAAHAGADAVLAGVGLVALGANLDAARLAAWAGDR
jgi:predicted NBD/HSP70 family sugar kinase